MSESSIHQLVRCLHTLRASPAVVSCQVVAWCKSVRMNCARGLCGSSLNAGYLSITHGRSPKSSTGECAQNKFLQIVYAHTRSFIPKTIHLTTSMRAVLQLSRACQNAETFFVCWAFHILEQLPPPPNQNVRCLQNSQTK